MDGWIWMIRAKEKKWGWDEILYEVGKEGFAERT